MNMICLKSEYPTKYLVIHVHIIIQSQLQLIKLLQLRKFSFTAITNNNSTNFILKYLRCKTPVYLSLSSKVEVSRVIGQNKETNELKAALRQC